MPSEDARSLPGAAQAALRKRAVQAVVDGVSQAEAARVFGVHPNAVNRWVKRYRQGGWRRWGRAVAGAARATRLPCRRASSKRSLRWFATAPPIGLGCPNF